MPPQQKVGFVGIGNMGWPMAANLVRAGRTLIVHDTDRDRAARFAAGHGCAAAGSLAELGASAGMVVTMLPTGAIVRRVLLEEEGGALAASLSPGAIVIDMSSSDPVGTRDLGHLLAAKGISLIDAPVSGGVRGAREATLSIMIGSDDGEAVARAEPVLLAMGKRLFRTGPSGSGHAMKALNNFVAAAGFTAAAEALIVGRRFGLDPAVMLDIINSSTGRNFNTEVEIKNHVLTRGFGSGFKLGLMAKDVRTAGDLSEGVAADAPLSLLLRDIWTRTCDALGADEDFTAAVRLWEKANGVTVAPK